MLIAPRLPTPPLQRSQADTRRSTTVVLFLNNLIVVIRSQELLIPFTIPDSPFQSFKTLRDFASIDIQPSHLKRIRRLGEGEGGKWRDVSVGR